MSQLELEDMQGILVRGHVDMEAAEFLILEISEGASARQWLRDLLPRITDALSKPEDERFQIAFTQEGLSQLGLDLDITENFRPEFLQGLTTEYRARLLGDVGESDADNWNWGGTRNRPVHMVLMHYAVDSEMLEEGFSRLESEMAAAGIAVVARLDTEMNPTLREHFGFRDGISQPIIPGLKKQGSPGNPECPAGEFFLGYPNAYDELPDSPVLPPERDPSALLPSSRNRAGMRDLGRNGSYMVFRQLRQDVKGFWEFLQEAVRRENDGAGAAEAIQLASKMVGRWPSGCPVTLSPDQDRPELERENDFLFQPEDKEGFRCPAGSHVRRSNPRDSLIGNNPEKAMKISQRHRILRRGRIFGPPLAPGLDPNGYFEAEEDGATRGLHFVCFNTNIARQFEFIQHTWTDNTKFQGMYEDPDPVLGIKDSRNKAQTHDFTMPAKPIRRKVQGLRRHVHVMGGAYFFMPGLRALKYLASLEPENH